MLGIFRISANGITLKEVQEQINHGNFPSLESFADEPHMVSGLLKLWLRVMPTPLCADFEKWSAVSGTVSISLSLSSFVSSVPLSCVVPLSGVCV